MTAFLTAIPARLWAALAAVGAVLAAIGAAFLRGRQSGVERERMRQMERAAEQRDTRDEIDRAVARDPDPAAELRRDWRRGL